MSKIVKSNRKILKLRRHIKYSKEIKEKVISDYNSGIKASVISKNTYYLCVGIDLFSRKVISYSIGKNNSSQLVNITFKK